MGALAASMKDMQDRIAGFTNRHHRIEITFTQVSLSFPRHSLTIKGNQVAQRMKTNNKKSPGETKMREVSWTLTKKLAQKRSSAGWWCWAIERVQLLLLQLFSNGGATDIVFVTLFCIAVGTAIAWCGGRCAMPDGHCRNILLFWRRSTAAFVFRVGACFEVSFFCPPFPTRPRP